MRGLVAEVYDDNIEAALMKEQKARLVSLTKHSLHLFSQWRKVELAAGLLRLAGEKGGRGYDAVLKTRPGERSCKPLTLNNNPCSRDPGWMGTSRRGSSKPYTLITRLRRE